MVANGATQSDPTGGLTDVTIAVSSCSDPSKCPPGFCYMRSLHGPFWQRTPFSVPIADTNYRGSFLRIFGESGLWKLRYYGNTMGLPPNAVPGGIMECTNFNEIAAVPDVSQCFANQFAIVDQDGTTFLDSVNATVAGATTVDVLSGYIGNIAQSNTGTIQDQPDTLRVFESSGTVQLIQLHDPTPLSPFALGPLKGDLDQWLRLPDCRLPCQGCIYDVGRAIAQPDADQERSLLHHGRDRRLVEHKEQCHPPTICRNLFRRWRRSASARLAYPR